MDTNKSYQIIRVAKKKYYELHMGQLRNRSRRRVSKSPISHHASKSSRSWICKVTIDAHQ